MHNNYLYSEAVRNRNKKYGYIFSGHKTTATGFHSQLQICFFYESSVDIYIYIQKTEMKHIQIENLNLTF